MKQKSGHRCARLRAGHGAGRVSLRSLGTPPRLSKVGLLRHNLRPVAVCWTTGGPAWETEEALRGLPFSLSIVVPPDHLVQERLAHVHPRAGP